jgi:hypothetical protein
MILFKQIFLNLHIHIPPEASKQASPEILNSLFMKGFLEQNIIIMPAR